MRQHDDLSLGFLSALLLAVAVIDLALLAAAVWVVVSVLRAMGAIE